MKFPAYWTRVSNSQGTITARGWSETSQEQAAAHAQDRLQRILAALSQQRGFDQLERYVYEVDSVICEEVIERIVEQGEELAVISRNAYGSLILNARKMMFVDIDFPSPPRPSLLARLFRKPPAETLPPQQQTLAKIEDWQARHPEFTLRLYRTFAGIRAIVVSHSFDKVDEQAVTLMNELWCDKLYVRLCQSQSCFRARLTPKPWRIGMKSPPTKKFPFDSDSQRQAFEVWSKLKASKSEHFKVCEFLAMVGTGVSLVEHQRLIEIHDSYCCGTGQYPLA